MKYLLPLIVLTIGFFSCSKKKEEQIVVLTLQEQLKQDLENSSFEHLNLSDSEYKYLNKFYEKSNYSPIWVNDSLRLADGDTLNYLLSNAYVFGTPLHRYALYENHQNYSLLEQENLITLKLAYLSHDLQEGYIDTAKRELKSKQPLDIEELYELINSKEENDWESHILNYYSPHEKYTQTLKGLNAFVKTYSLDTNAYKISAEKEDSLLSTQQAKIALYTKGFINTPEIGDSSFTDALKKFQEINGIETDGVLGKNTVAALNESNVHKYNRAVLALDKWRWKNNYPDKYIWVNVPAYELNFYINDSLKRQHKVVVGTTKNRTPEFSANMKTVVAYPYWHVPYSISSQEILYHVKRDTTYLERNHYKLFKNGDAVDPKTVDWSKIGVTTFPFRVRQDGGNHNSLGLVKLLFPNKHNVYIHDTPSKRFFDKTVRSYSHGCIRCQNPLELASYILERDGNENTRDSLDTIIKRRVQKTITLNKPFPVFIDYISVGTDNNNSIVFYKDIYSKDEEWISLFDK